MAEMQLKAPSSRRKSRVQHQRTVTRFCDEANIGENDQLDLAEFIVAAHYLGAAADDSQLMDIFMKMEDTEAHQGKNPKEVIKQLMSEVEDKYGSGSLAGLSEVKEMDENDESEDHEVVGKTLGDAVLAEDAQWQEVQIDGFLSAAAQHQNLQIAKKLFQDTTLSKKDIAEITNIDIKLLDFGDEEEYDTDEEEEDDGNEDSKTVDQSKVGGADISNAESVVIKSEEFGKQIALTNSDLSTLDELVIGGKDAIGQRSDEVILLLKKLQGAVRLAPGGARALKKIRYHSSLNVNLNENLNQNANNNNNNANNNANNNNNNGDSNENSDANKQANHVKQATISVTSVSNTNTYLHAKGQSSVGVKNDGGLDNVKLPAKFRVVIHPGALVKEKLDIKSGEVAKIPIGTVVILEHIDGRRGRISSPVAGWVSLHAKDGRVILQKENTTSKEMENAVHAQRARQTKILILKSITTLNDATVTRILEKSDWNLRRAIEAFYMAKYKTQQFMEEKERQEQENEEANSKDNDNKNNKGRGKKKSNAKNWWKSWTTFAKQNK